VHHSHDFKHVIVSYLSLPFLSLLC